MISQLKPKSFTVFAVPVVAIREKPLSISFGIRSCKYFLSLSFTLTKTFPEVTIFFFAASWALAYASPKVLPIPITSPVDFISGPKIGSTRGNLSKGITASLTNDNSGDKDS